MNVASCYHLKAEGLQHVAEHFQELTHFNSSGLNNGGRSAAIVSILRVNEKTLEKVELSGPVDLKWNGSDFLTQLSRMPQLTVLDISEMMLPSHKSLQAALSYLSPTLRILRMSRCGLKNNMVGIPVIFYIIMQITCRFFYFAQFDCIIL